MEKIYVNGKGLINSSEHDNGKFAVYGALPGDEQMILLTSCENMKDLKEAKTDYEDVFKEEGIILSATTNKGKTIPLKVK